VSLKRASLVSVASQIAAITYSLISLPMLLSAYGDELFGIWGLISSLVAYLSLSSFGIPTAMTSYLASSNSWPDRLRIYKKSFRLLFLLIVLVVVIVVPTSVYVQWEIIFGKVSNENIGPAKIAASIMLVGFLLKTPFTIATAAFAGVHRVDLTKLYELINSTVAFGCLLGVLKIGGDLVLLAGVTTVATLGISLIAFVHFSFAFERGNTENSACGEGFPYKKLLGKGVYFFQVGVASTIIWNTHPFVISHIIGAEAIASYTIPHRLYTLATSLLTIFSGLLIPLIASLAIGRADERLQRLYGTLYVIFPLASGSICIGGFFLAQPLINIWTGRNDMQIDHALIFFLGAYAFILPTIHLRNVFLTAFNSAQAYAKVSWMEAGLNLAITIPAVYILGVAGAALGAFFAGLLCSYIITKKLLLIEGINEASLKRYERLHFCLIAIFAFTASWVSNLISGQLWFSLFVGLLLIATYILTFVVCVGRDGRQQLVETFFQFAR
jgi:O-antigen/teichoic acid export membrane protein